MELVKLAAACILYKLANPLINPQMPVQNAVPPAKMNDEQRSRYGATRTQRAMTLQQQQAIIQKLMQQQQMMQQAAKPNRPDMMGAKFPWLGPARDVANIKPIQQAQGQLQQQKFGR